MKNRMSEGLANNGEVLKEAMERTPRPKEALAQPEQEPVAWRAPNWGHGDDEWVYRDFDDPVLIADGKPSSNNEALYTTPPQLKEPEQAPVAWSDYESNGIHHKPVAWMDADGNVSDNNDHKFFPIPLYTTPPQRTWVGLTDEQIYEIHENSSNLMEFTRAIEAKLKEKNT